VIYAILLQYCNFASEVHQVFEKGNIVHCLYVSKSASTPSVLPAAMLLQSLNNLLNMHYSFISCLARLLDASEVD